MSLLTRIMHLTVGVTLFALTPVMAFSAVNPVKGTNPISSSLLPSTGLPGTTTVGHSYGLVYTLRNNLPFNELVKAITFNANGLGFTVVDNCGGKTLAANGGTCQVQVEFQPVRTGPASIQVYMQYDKNVVPLGPLSTNAVSGATGEIEGTVSERLPAGTTVGTGYTVKFTYTNDSNASITASSITFFGDTSDFTHDAGCVAPLLPSHSCTIEGTFTPSTDGSTLIGSSYNYDAGTKSVLLHTSTVASGSSGDCASVNGSGPLLLPTSTYVDGNNVVEVKFINQCDHAAATLGTVNWSGTLGGSSIVKTAGKPTKDKKEIKGAKNKLGQSVTSWITPGTAAEGLDNCSGQTIAANGSCTVYATVIPQAVGTNLNITASVPYTESSQSKTATYTTASDVLQNDSTNRMITVINQCSIPVWTAFNGGAVINSPACTANPSSCPTGSTCNTAANSGAGICYFSNPTTGVTPNGLLSGVVSNRAPKTMDISISESNGGTTASSVVYNGSIFPRLGCSGSGSSLSCLLNNCTPDSNGLCIPGDGPNNGPANFNQMEFTMNRTGGDGVYNDTSIDGFAVPMEMKGRGPFAAGAPYTCTSTGAVIQPVTNDVTTQLGNCNFQYTLTAGAVGDVTDYRYVLPSTPNSPTYCDTDGDCGGADPVCGLGYKAVGNTINKVCGVLEGYEAINKGICSQGYAAFGRSKSLTTLTTPTFATSLYGNSDGTPYAGSFNCAYNYGSYTQGDLYGCSGPLANSSCYNGASPCCGCKNWWDAGITIPHPGTTQSCNGVTNSNWNDTGPQASVQWMKAGCPTSYVYQYDDVSSSFGCSVINGGLVTTNYQVTLCPATKEVSTITTTS